MRETQTAIQYLVGYNSGAALPDLNP